MPLIDRNFEQKRWEKSNKNHLAVHNDLDVDGERLSGRALLWKQTVVKPIEERKNKKILLNVLYLYTCLPLYAMNQHSIDQNAHKCHSCSMIGKNEENQKEKEKLFAHKQTINSCICCETICICVLLPISICPEE